MNGLSQKTFSGEAWLISICSGFVIFLLFSQSLIARSLTEEDRNELRYRSQSERVYLELGLLSQRKIAIQTLETRFIVGDRIPDRWTFYRVLTLRNLLTSNLLVLRRIGFQFLAREPGLLDFDDRHLLKLLMESKGENILENIPTIEIPDGFVTNAINHSDSTKRRIGLYLIMEMLRECERSNEIDSAIAKQIFDTAWRVYGLRKQKFLEFVRDNRNEVEQAFKLARAVELIMAKFYMPKQRVEEFLPKVLQSLDPLEWIHYSMEKAKVDVAWIGEHIRAKVLNDPSQKSVIVERFIQLRQFINSQSGTRQEKAYKRRRAYFAFAQQETEIFFTGTSSLDSDAFSLCALVLSKPWMLRE